VTCYEYPFNERIRTLLRLEDLYEKFSFFIEQKHQLNHHVAISTIFEMLEIAGRADLKSDLLQELERQKQSLMSFKSNPNVEINVLDEILSELNQTSSELISMKGKAGQNIRDNDWLMLLRGRTSIPGGACEFDIPSYHAWQQNDFEKRKLDIEDWFFPLKPLFAAINLILRLLRKTANSSDILAIEGSYQQMLQGKSYQMLQVHLDHNKGVVPEISANKYVLWIRFISQVGNSKQKTLNSDIPFKLTLCAF